MNPFENEGTMAETEGWDELGFETETTGEF
jgi:hypothetical protein